MTTIRGRTEWQRLVDDKLKSHDARLTEQEKTNAVYQALAEEQRKHINDRFNRMQDNITDTKTDLSKDLSSLKSSINRVLLAVVIAIVLAFIRVAMSGTLSI